jgi:hypothetical protein
MNGIRASLSAARPTARSMFQRVLLTQHDGPPPPTKPFKLSHSAISQPHVTAIAEHVVDCRSCLQRLVIVEMGL